MKTTFCYTLEFRVVLLFAFFISLKSAIIATHTRDTLEITTRNVTEAEEDGVSTDVIRENVTTKEQSSEVSAEGNVTVSLKEEKGPKNEEYAKQNSPLAVMQSLFCGIVPAACFRREKLQRHLFHFQGRGIKDTIGIISTVLAAMLGAILVKMNTLVVLSLISIAVGKLILLFLVFKSSHGYHHGSPIVISDRNSQHHPAYYNDDIDRSPFFGGQDGFMYKYGN